LKTRSSVSIWPFETVSNRLISNYSIYLLKLSFYQTVPSLCSLDTDVEVLLDGTGICCPCWKTLLLY